METWLIYAVLAALSWGTYIVINKLAASQGINPFAAALAMGVGIIGIFGILFLATRARFEGNLEGIGLSVLAGIVWAIGMVFALLALSNKAPVAKLNPIYNTNTLITVLIGVILLHELPSGTEKIKVIIGAILIVIGGILVSG